MSIGAYWVWALFPFIWLSALAVDERFNYLHGGSTCAFVGYFVGTAAARFALLYQKPEDKCKTQQQNRQELMEMWWPPLLVATMLVITNTTWFTNFAGATP